LEAGGSGGVERNFQFWRRSGSEVHEDDVAGLERPAALQSRRPSFMVARHVTTSVCAVAA
jgi:hypothetical protein